MLDQLEPGDSAQLFANALTWQNAILPDCR